MSNRYSTSAASAGAQLRCTDLDGYRFTYFSTDTKTGPPAGPEPRHRRRARREERIRAAVARLAIIAAVTFPKIELHVRSGSTKQLGSAVGDGIAGLLMTRPHLEAHHQRP